MKGDIELTTKLVKQIDEDVKLYMDDKTGIAWLVDSKTGARYCPHPSIPSHTDLYSRWSGGGKERIKIGIAGLTYDVSVSTISNSYDQIAKDNCLCVCCRKEDSIMKLLKINELKTGKLYDMVNNPNANYLLYFVDNEGNLCYKDAVVKGEGKGDFNYNTVIKTDFYEV